MTDPEDYVDRFGEQAERWRKWRAVWETHASAGSAVPGESFKAYDSFTAKLLRDLDELFKTQDQINIMMLAALDDLRKREGQ